MLNDARNTVKIYLWTEPERVFVRTVSFDLTVDAWIEGLTPGDYNYDGKLDVLLMLNRSGVLNAEIYLQAEGNSFDPIPFFLLNATNHPAALDLNGDMAVDFIYNTINSQGVEQAVVAEKRSSSYVQKRLSDYAFLSSEVCLQPSDRKLTSPHSVAFVDLNKDCWADLFLTTEDEAGKVYFEVWLNMRSGTYCIVQAEEAPEGAGQVSFADVDRNGVEDLIFPTPGHINVVFNDNQHSNDCRFEAKDITFTSFKQLEFAANTNSSTASLALPLDTGLSFSPGTEEMPLILRPGDLDLDGYPDFLVPIEDSEGTFCAFYRNIRDGSTRRSFKLDSNSDFDQLKGKRGAYLCSFFDLDENGIPDILLTHRNSTVSTTVSYYNNFLDDAFHLKALSLDGYGKQKYSSAYSGPVFMFTVTELDMTPVQIHSTQLPQTAYFSLQTPYCLYGLGRTNSYVEQFYVNIPSLAHSAKMWTPIIPNSYLIVSPKRAKSPTKQVDIDAWFLELFASPTDKIGVVIIGAAFFLLGIGGFVLYRYRKEKEEDRQLVVGFL